MEAKVIEGLLERINKSVKWEQADAPTFIWEVYSILCKDELRIRSDDGKRRPFTPEELRKCTTCPDLLAKVARHYDNSMR